MSDLDLAGLQAAAAADLRPRASTPEEIPTGSSHPLEYYGSTDERIIEEYRPGDSVYEFLSARTLDTTVPPY